MSSIDAIFSELSAVVARLAALDPGAAAERAALEARRTELRESARLAGGPTTRADAELLLEQLLRRRQQLLDGHIDVVRQAGEFAHVGTGLETMRLNAAIDEAAGRDALEQKIAELRRRIAAWPSEPESR